VSCIESAASAPRRDESRRGSDDVVPGDRNPTPHRDKQELTVTAFYDGVLSPHDAEIAERLATVESRMARAAERSGRGRADITLVAVSKKFSAGHLRAGYAAGLREFGENYIQEFAEKRPELDDLTEAKYHFIGHLQSNKARLAGQLFDVIQTVDSAKLLARLDAELEVLLEVKLSDEENKSGARPEEVPALLEAAARYPHLAVTGLMTMPPWSTDAEHSRPYFKQLAALAREVGLKKLSMGVSGDLEVAIEEGATIVRVGTALFGPRAKPGLS
jgi:PLP dependent protein